MDQISPNKQQQSDNGLHEHVRAFKLQNRKYCQFFFQLNLASEIWKKHV